MIIKLLTDHHLEFLSLKRGCRGSSESTHVKMPHCWKTHALAQFIFLTSQLKYKLWVLKKKRLNGTGILSTQRYMFSLDKKIPTRLFAPLQCMFKTDAQSH